MSATEYTPTTSQVRDGYAATYGTGTGSKRVKEGFHRWLAAHDAQVRADERERIAAAIEVEYLGPDAFRHYDGTEDPQQRFADAYDEGLQVAARIARSGGRELAEREQEKADGATNTNPL